MITWSGFIVCGDRIKVTGILIISGIKSLFWGVENIQPILYFLCAIYNYMMISLTSIHQGKMLTFQYLGAYWVLIQMTTFKCKTMQILLSLLLALPCSPSSQTLLSTQLPCCLLSASSIQQERMRDVGCCGGGWEGKQVMSAAATLTKMALFGKGMTSLGLSYLGSAL